MWFSVKVTILKLHFDMLGVLVGDYLFDAYFIAKKTPGSTITLVKRLEEVAIEDPYA